MNHSKIGVMFANLSRFRGHAGPTLKLSKAENQLFGNRETVTVSSRHHRHRPSRKFAAARAARLAARRSHQVHQRQTWESRCHGGAVMAVNWPVSLSHVGEVTKSKFLLMFDGEITGELAMGWYVTPATSWWRIWLKWCFLSQFKLLRVLTVPQFVY